MVKVKKLHLNYKFVVFRKGKKLGYVRGVKKKVFKLSSGKLILKRFKKLKRKRDFDVKDFLLKKYGRFFFLKKKKYSKIRCKFKIRKLKRLGKKIFFTRKEDIYMHNGEVERDFFRKSYGIKNRVCIGGYYRWNWKTNMEEKVTHRFFLLNDISNDKAFNAFYKPLKMENRSTKISLYRYYMKSLTLGAKFYSSRSKSKSIMRLKKKRNIIQ